MEWIRCPRALLVLSLLGLFCAPTMAYLQTAPSRAQTKNRQRERLLASTIGPVPFAKARNEVEKNGVKSVDLEFEGGLDGGDHLSCLDMFLHRTEASACRAVPVRSDWNGPPIVMAELCNTTDGGALLAVHTYIDQRVVFHASLIGPQVMVLPWSVCSSVQRSESNEKAYKVEGRPMRTNVHYLLMNDVVPGEYELSVRMLFSGFSSGYARYSHHCWQPIWKLPLVFEANENRTCTFCSPKPELWPTCTKAYVTGSVLSKSGSTSLPHTLGLRLDAWKDKLHWQPQGCNFLPNEDIDIKTCLEDKVVCFVGDSHFRHLHNGVIDAMEPHGVKAVNTTPDKVSYKHPRVPHFWEEWGDLGRLEQNLTSAGCTHILFNTGAWPLSHRAPSRWTAGHYASVLSKAFKVARNMMQSQPGRRVFWVPSNMHAFPCGNRDSRVPPYADIFNELSIRLAQRHGIDVINTYDITRPLYTLAQDSVHHHYIGLTGASMTNYVLNAVCVQGPGQRDT